jgi:hypothetical protein
MVGNGPLIPEDEAMRFGVAAVVLAVAVGRADAQFIKAESAPYAQPVTIGGVVHYPAGAGWAPRTSTLTVARLQPVVGSLQRTGHFAHKAKYSETVYNPLLGQFSTHRLRR